jgi:hypothetical protein
MATLSDTLTKLLKKRNLLYTEYVGSAPDCTLTKTLIEAITTCHTLTPQQFKLFINQATYGKRSGFLASNDICHVAIIKGIFTKHDIEIEKITEIIMNLYRYNSRFESGFLECLFEKKYDFDNNLLKFLINKDYISDKVECYDRCHKNLIYIGSVSLLHDKWVTFNKCLEIIKNDKEPFNSTFFEIFMQLIKRGKYISIQMEIFMDALCKDCTSHDFFMMFEIKQNFPEIHGDIINYIIKKFGYSETFLKILISERYSIAYIYKLITDGHKLTIEHLHMLLSDDIRFKLPNDKYGRNEEKRNYEKKMFNEIITQFKKCNVIPNLVTLNITCKKGYHDVALELLTTYDILPNKETLESSVSSLNIDLVNAILKYKIIPDNDIIYKLINNDPKKVETAISIVELLIMYGFKINFEHINHLLSQKLYLEDLNRFGIEYDEKLYFACFLNEYHPDTYMNKYEPVRMEFYRMCRSKKITYMKLKEFMEKNDVKIDKYALDYIVSDKAKLGARVLEKLQCELPLITVYKKFNVSDKSLKDIIDKYKITGENMREVYSEVL